MAVVNFSIREHLRRTKLPQSVDLFRFENMVDEDADAINDEEDSNALQMIK